MRHLPGRTFGAIALVIAGLFVMAFRQAMAADGPPGITRPVVLPPFDAAAPNCRSPSGLQRVPLAKRGPISFLAASMVSRRRLPRLDWAAPSRPA